MTAAQGTAGPPPPTPALSASAPVTVPLNAKQLVDRLWSYCRVLRHDGVSTVDYVDRFTAGSPV